MSDASQNGETKPFSTDLTPQQLAAYRWLAHGLSSTEVAKLIGSTQRPINRWKLLPAIRAELRRLHNLMAIGLTQSHPRGAVARKTIPLQSRPMRRPIVDDMDDELMSDDEVHETEAMIDEILGKARK
jgi:hypothetical protein